MTYHEKGSLGYYTELASKNGFNSWSEYYKWMKDNDKLPKVTYTNEKWCKEKGFNNQKEYRDHKAQDKGFINDSERRKTNDYERGIYSPMEDNEECTRYFGEFIAENYIIKTFEDPIKMPPNNPGYDWLCKNGLKIDSKARCLYSNGEQIGWQYRIDFNNIADIFILSGWDNRDSLNPLHVWIFYKNDIVRNAPFWNRNGFWITDKREHLIEFERYEAVNRLEKLKEFCHKVR